MSRARDLLDGLPARETWMSAAVCAEADPNVFFPPEVQDEAREARELAVALEICSECRVTAQCLDFALRNRINHGVYGALSPRGRTRVRRARERMEERDE